MALKFAPLRMMLLAVAVSAFCTAALGDTIRLKDGGILKGKIVAFSAGRFTLSIGEGSRKRELTLSVSEIESIEFDETHTASNTVAANDDPNSELPAAGKPVPETYRETSLPVAKDPPVATRTEMATVPASSRTDSAVKPIELSVKVLADDTGNGWTNTGWVVKAGQKIKITGLGEVSIGSGKTTSASGLYDVEDDSKLLANVPTGALIAVIGDDNNEFIYIGSEREFTATRDGSLFLGLNEGDLEDNTGSFDVKVQIWAGGPN